MKRREWIENPKVVFHPDWLKRYRKDPFSVPPIYLEISPAGACNHRCTFCAPEMLGYQTRFLNPEILRLRFEEMKAMREADPDGLGVRSIQFAGEGEPTLHRGFGKMLGFARAVGIDVGVLTNATGLVRNRLPEILPNVNGYLQVSVNAGIAESYAAIHQTKPRDWDLIWNNLSEAVNFKRQFGLECDIGANMTVLVKDIRDERGNVVPANWQEMEALARKARDTGLDYVSFKPYSQHPYSVATARHYGDMSYAETLPEIVAIGERLKNELNSPGFEVVFRFTRFKEYEDERHYTVCRATPAIWSYIQSDGVWISCSAHWTNEAFHLGTINTEPVREIWFGDKRRRHLKFVLEKLDISVCRKTCHPDKENAFLDKLAGFSEAEFDAWLEGVRELDKPKRANFI